MGGGSVLVTGARGALGASIVRTLLARGTERLLLARRDDGAGDLPAGAGVGWIRIDLQEDRVDLPAGIDVVIHAAGEKRDETRMQAVNHHGTRKLAEAAVRAGIGRFVHVSSVGVYGADPRAGVVDESRPHRPANAYELSKDQGERAVREVCAAAAIDGVVLQPSNVVAPVPGKAWPLLGFLTAIQRGRLVRFDRGDAWLNYIAVDDVAAATAQVALGPRLSGTFIVNTPERLEQVVAWAAESLRVPAPRLRLPAWTGRLACHASALADRWLGRPGPIDRERLRELTGTTRFDGGALERVTGLVYPIGVRGMLASLVFQYTQEGRL